MKKKFLFTTALSASAIAIAATGASAQTEEVLFKDVEKDKPFYDSIQALSQLGVVSGYPDGTFKPTAKITRGQAAKMIVDAFSLQHHPTVRIQPFPDVNEANPFFEEIHILASHGIVSGDVNRLFKANDSVSRGHFAIMLAKAIEVSQQTTLKTKASSFKDVSGYLKEPIEKLLAYNITSGTTVKTFSPKEAVTRGQAAALLARAALYTQYKQEPFDLTIMHVNDTHSRVEQFPKLITAVENVRAESDASVLLHAGDVFSGTLYFNEFVGQADLAFMNEMGFDAMTFGNHEFDLGVSEDGHAALASFIKGANFPIVSSNVDITADPDLKGLYKNKYQMGGPGGHVFNGIVKTINGEKVGIFGLTTEETKTSSFPGAVTFENYIEEAQHAVNTFKRLGVNKVVALSHLGYDDSALVDNDLLLAKHVDGIDVIVGGHSHTELKQPVTIAEDENGQAKDATIIVQAYQYADYLGTLDVTFNERGVVTAYNGELVKVADVAPNEAATAMLASFKEKVDALQLQEIGVTLAAPLDNPRASETSTASVRANETILGNIITDGMLQKARQFTGKNVVMAMQNGGGIRASIPAGAVTVGQVITVLPFGNTLALIDVTGAELKAAFEVSVGKLPAESGGFLHVSGGRVTYDSTKASDSRVVLVELKNADGTYTAIQADQTYTVATNAFTAKGGDGFTMFADAYADGRVTDLGLSDWENFAQHLQSGVTIPTAVEGRLIDVSKTAK